MLNVNDVTQLYLGIQGENGTRTITIDVAPWLVAHPEGSVSIWHKRNGDSTPSATGAVFDDEAGTITWTPTGTDTYVAGEGEAEIRLTESTVIKKTRTIRTGVSPAVTGGGQTLGSDWQSYINEVDRIKSLAVAAKEAAVAAKTAAETSEENSEAWAVGQRDGVDVSSDDPTYQNNAKYYAGTAKTDSETATGAAATATAAAATATEKAGAASSSQAAAAQSANAAASARAGAEAAERGAKGYQELAAGSASYAAEKAVAAANSATAAAGSATAAATSADRAETAARDAGYMFFYIDENGDLIMNRTSNLQVDFYLSQGDLYVKGVA